MVNVHLRNPNYVLVLLVKKQSIHSRIFYRKYWSSTKRALKRISSKIKFEVVKCTELTDCCSTENKYPQGLQMWNFCYPNILLIPSQLWDKACRDPQQSLAVWNGVHAFNITSHPNFSYLPKYTNAYWLNRNGVVDWFINVSEPARGK